jgi:hypothetical protein
MNSLTFNSPETSMQHALAGPPSMSISPESYRMKKEQVKEVFISKDELFKRVSKKFKSLLKAKGKRIERKKNEIHTRLQGWD